MKQRDKAPVLTAAFAGLAIGRDDLVFEPEESGARFDAEFARQR